MNRRSNIIAPSLVLILIFVGQFLSHSAGAQLGKITEVTIAVDRETYSGPCPTRIKLKGQLRADGPIGVVRYQFMHSDGSVSAVSELTINDKGVFTVEETLEKRASWNDTVYLKVYTPGPTGPAIQLDSRRVPIKGDCQMLQAPPRQASLLLGPASGRFRVTLNGFTCNRQTRDFPLSPDGADDEVFLFTKSFFVERRGEGSDVNVSAPLRRRTPIFGDTASVNFPGRIQGGSGRAMGANGGFRAGDSFPASPERHSTNPQPYVLPQLIWEGELTRRRNAIVIVPMIWEWDGQPGLFEAWEAATLEQFYDVGRLIADPNLTDQELAIVALRGEIVGQIRIHRGNLGDIPGDRPIGTSPYGDDYRFRPQLLILTYDEALRLADQSRRKNGEALPIVYADSPELGGNYTLYVQIEQLP